MNVIQWSYLKQQNPSKIDNMIPVKYAMIQKQFDQINCWKYSLELNLNYLFEIKKSNIIWQEFYRKMAKKVTI